MFAPKKFRLQSYAGSVDLRMEIESAINFGKQPRTPFGTFALPWEDNPFDYSDVNPTSGKIFGKKTKKGIEIRYDLPRRGSSTVLVVNVVSEKNGSSCVNGAFHMAPRVSATMWGSLLFFWGCLGFIVALVAQYTSAQNMNLMLVQGLAVSLIFVIPIFHQMKESENIDEPQMKKLLRDAISRAEKKSSVEAHK